MATLSNLGDTQMEDSLIIMVNDLYHYSKEFDTENLFVFYNTIVPNSIGLLQSKRSILETLYMLNEEEVSPFENYDDVGDVGYSLGYFYLCINPKLKDLKIEHLASSDFEKNKEQIKALIVNDDSIWQNHIRRK